MYKNKYDLLINIKKLSEFSIPIMEMEKAIIEKGYSKAAFYEAFNDYFGFEPDPHIYNESYFNAPSCIPPFSIAWGISKKAEGDSPYPAYYISKIPSIGYALTLIDNKYSTSIISTSSSLETLVKNLKDDVKKLETIDKKISIKFAKEEPNLTITDVDNIIDSLPKKDLEYLKEEQKIQEELLNLPGVKSAAKDQGELPLNSPENMTIISNLLESSLDGIIKTGKLDTNYFLYIPSDYEADLILRLTNNTIMNLSRYGISMDILVTLLDKAEEIGVDVQPIRNHLNDFKQNLAKELIDENDLDKLMLIDENAEQNNENEILNSISDDIENIKETTKLSNKKVSSFFITNRESFKDDFFYLPTKKECSVKKAADYLANVGSSALQETNDDAIAQALNSVSKENIAGYGIVIKSAEVFPPNGFLENFFTNRDIEISDDDKIVVLMFDINKIGTKLSLKDVYQIYIYRDKEIISNNLIYGDLISSLPKSKDSLDSYFTNLEENRLKNKEMMDNINEVEIKETDYLADLDSTILVPILVKAIEKLIEGSLYTPTPEEMPYLLALDSGLILTGGITSNDLVYLLDKAKKLEIDISDAEQLYLNWRTNLGDFDRNDELMYEEGLKVQNIMQDPFAKLNLTPNAHKSNAGVYQKILNAFKNLNVGKYIVEVNYIGSNLDNAPINVLDILDNDLAIFFNIKGPNGEELNNVYQLFNREGNKLISDGKLRGLDLEENLPFNEESLDVYFNTDNLDNTLEEYGFEADENQEVTLLNKKAAATSSRVLPEVQVEVYNEARDVSLDSNDNFLIIDVFKQLVEKYLDDNGLIDGYDVDITYLKVNDISNEEKRKSVLVGLHIKDRNSEAKIDCTQFFMLDDNDKLVSDGQIQIDALVGDDKKNLVAFNKEGLDFYFNSIK